MNTYIGLVVKFGHYVLWEKNYFMIDVQRRLLDSRKRFFSRRWNCYCENVVLGTKIVINLKHIGYFPQNEVISRYTCWVILRINNII